MSDGKAIRDALLRIDYETPETRALMEKLLRVAGRIGPTPETLAQILQNVVSGVDPVFKRRVKK